MPDTRYSFHHNETTTTTSTTTLRNDLTHSLTYLWISWFLLNWRMTWCGLFVLVGNTSSRYIDGIFQQQIFGWCVVVVLSMDIVVVVNCSLRLAARPSQRKMGWTFSFPGFSHFSDSYLSWLNYLISFCFISLPNSDRCGPPPPSWKKTMCVWYIWYRIRWSADSVLNTSKTLFTSLNSRDRRKCFQYSCRPYSQLRYVGTMKSIVPMIRDLSLPYNPCWYY